MTSAALKSLCLAAPLTVALCALLASPLASAAPPEAPPPAVIVAPAPAPTVVVAPAPAPAPAPVVVAPAPAPEIVVVPQPAAPDVVVVPAPAEPVVVVEQATAPQVVIVKQPEPKVVVVEQHKEPAVKIIVKSDEKDEVVEETVEHHTHTHKLRWAGLSVSTVFSPVPSSGKVSEARGRLGSNKFRACLQPKGQACGYIKGFDFKVQMFESKGSRDYPWIVGYFRTGYTAGRVDMDPGSNDFREGQVTSLRYVAVPLYFGGNVYLFGNFPIRPYAGLGAGFDVLRLEYRKRGAERQLDASGRIGFELHAGLEGRISNFVSLHAEVMQLWSARRKLGGVPDFSNSGLSVLAGVTVAIPTNLRDYHEHHTVRRTRKVTKH